MLASTDKASPSASSHRVLVVDDSSVARRQLRQALEGVGIGVGEAAEGVEALWRVRQQPYDLIITDIHMPAMDGLQLLRELRTIPGNELTPVFVLTSDGSRERLSEGRAAGVSGWFVKPANVPMLMDAVLTMLGKRPR